MPERLSRGTAPPHRRPLTLQRPAGAAQGFTLIEVMVVLVIIALTATGISVALDAVQGREASRAVERLRLVLEATAERASVRGQPIAVEFIADGYRFSAFETDGNWRPLIDPPVFAEKLLPDDVVRGRLLVEGLDQSATPRLVFGTTPPQFTLELGTPEGRVTLAGRPTGAVTVRNEAKAIP
ncbi:MAG: prepilin-type N-terminal cleavage/methylation domain-containing protein [Rhodocyclaceae bacterium]|nr:prepilin-type N-terminal cleavage/methylation domain-containing protein [Rhodocyclaceae bacterium]